MKDKCNENVGFVNSHCQFSVLRSIVSNGDEMQFLVSLVKFIFMRNVLSLLLFLFVSQLFGQGEEKAQVQKTIETFFEGFHAQDSMKIKETISEDVVIQTISMTEEGNVTVKDEELVHFLRSIVSIPKTTQFREIIKDFTIQIDGPMAHAWTPYEFRLNHNFHHCGVNSFQLVKDTDKGWQIIYIVDTRRRKPCE